MAIKHINAHEKVESGVVVSGKDAKKVIQILSDPNITKNQFMKSPKSLKEAIDSLKKLKI